MLLRTRARRRPGACRGSGGRRRAARPVLRRRRRDRARRGPRGDRDARRRPRGHAGRRVPLGDVRRPPRGPAGDRQRRLHLVDDAQPTAFVPPPSLHPRPDGGGGGGQHRPSRGRRAGARALRRPAGARPFAGAAPQGRRPGGRAPDVAAGEARRRADPSVDGGPHPGPALGSALGAVGAQHRARRWAEFAPVPTDPGDARAGVLGVLDGGHLRRQRRAVDLRRLPAGAVRRGGPGDHRRARRGGARRHHRRASAGSPRGRCAAVWFSGWRIRPPG